MKRSLGIVLPVSFNSPPHKVRGGPLNIKRGGAVFDFHLFYFFPMDGQNFFLVMNAILFFHYFYAIFFSEISCPAPL